MKIEVNDDSKVYINGKECIPTHSEKTFISDEGKYITEGEFYSSIKKPEPIDEELDVNDPNWKRNYKKMKPDAVIIDIDGTLANIEHRRIFVEGGKKDWGSFLHPENIQKDSINLWCKYLVNILRERCQVIFVSGREESLRNITYKFINQHFNNFNFFLEMRLNGDYRQDSIIKEEIYFNKIKPYYNILFCIDDRKQVVDMWRSHGLVCLQCDEGNF